MELNLYLKISDGSGMFFEFLRKNCSWGGGNNIDSRCCCSGQQSSASSIWNGSRQTKSNTDKNRTAAILVSRSLWCAVVSSLFLHFFAVVAGV